MLRNLIILTLFFVAVSAAGEFIVLSNPKSIAFKGNEALPSEYVGDVLYASMGNAVAGDAKWSGLNINDPFNLAKGVIAVSVNGLEHISTNSNAKVYELIGSNSDESLNALSAELEASNEPVCDVNFVKGEQALSDYAQCFGSKTVPALQETSKYLKPADNKADKEFLQSIAYVNAAAANLANMQKESNFIVFRLNLDGVIRAHGEKSEAVVEAKKLISSTVANLNAAAQKLSNNNALVVAIASEKTNGRVKRQAESSAPAAADKPQTRADDTPYNLAEYYNQDYPVMFNLILWFSVVFFLTLLAICYAIYDMDPGRDSIIYRMTSTRMKKDN